MMLHVSLPANILHPAMQLQVNRKDMHIRARVHVSSQLSELTLLPPQLLGTDVETQSVALIPSISSQSGFHTRLEAGHTRARSGVLTGRRQRLL